MTDAEQTEVADEATEAADASPEDTGQTAENQEQEASEPPAVEPESPLQAFDAFCAQVNDLMDEKERLALTYVDQNAPKPYFDSWVEEINSTLRLAVRLRRLLTS